MSTEAQRPDLVLLEEHETYAVIRINRPEKRNAMNRAARTQMMDALDRVRDRFRVCILTGTDSSFCAGIDLKERHQDRIAGNDTAPEEWLQVNLQLRRHPSIFIAAVNGYALGGGVTLINVCDLALAAEDAQIGTPEMGFATYAGLAGPTTQLTLSRKRAAWLLLTTRRITGATAETWGLVNMAVPREKLMDEARRLASEIAQFDPIALEETKRALDRIPFPIHDWEMAMRYGSLVNASIRSRTDAQVKGVERFSRGERNVGQG